jgi:flagellar hook protein FlgE
MPPKSFCFTSQSIAFLLFLYFTVPSFGQQLPYKQDLGAMGIKGRVHKLTETTYDVSENKERIYLQSRRLMFNRIGNTVYELAYNKKGKPKWLLRYHYVDLWEEDLLTLCQHYSYDSNGTKKLENKTIYTYEVNPSNTSQLTSRKIKNYYAKYNSTVDIEEYNKDNLRVSSSVYRSKFDVDDSKTTFAYDSRGNKIEEKFYFTNNELTNHRKYAYNAKNQLVKYEYFRKDKLWNSYTQKFNAKGDVIEKIWYASDGTVEKDMKFSYSYDTNNNWIQKFETVNGKHRLFYTRVYIYY